MASKILIADDEAFIRFLITQTFEELEEQGTQILTADDGEKALEMARQEQPDLIFLDVMMPKANGFDVCQAIKRDERLKNAYVVILTAKGQEVDRLQGEQVGANRFITKPFDPDELTALAESVLNHS